ncbi:MAG: response regulator [Treponema sp.]|jgi:signal transduction histidine kinase|nr:response regulator [Treponema sp.]
MNGERKKIFAVDDNPENLIALRSTLKGIYGVYPCPSALEMFDLLEHIRPDLILLDVEMPDMSGYEAIKKLKSNDKNKNIPVIFLTSMIDEQSEIEGLKLGAVDYIHKPFITPLLLQRINTHLSLMEQQKVILDRNKEIEELLEIKTKDISLREAAEQEAQNASRARSEFLSHMSHEIRSPLNAVIGMINIATEADDIQSIRNYLEKAGRASKHILEVINDILDMSKIEAGKLKLSYDEFDFGKMLTDIIDETSIYAVEKHQDFEVKLSENVPRFLIGDELRLSQVITNLLTNAIKFTPENGKVELCAEKLDETYSEITMRIEVSDSGIGISPEQQKKLFTPYNQADSSITKNLGGTGLKLVISKHIVELMRGTIWIESELDKGSKFIFTIKMKKGTESAGKVLPCESEGEDFYFKEYTILIAENVEINREILSAYLEKTGISIDFAVNGKKAVSIFMEYPDRYNLIFMDNNMPEMDGNEATREIRAFEKKLVQNAAGNNSGSITESKTQSNNKNLRKQIPIIAMIADAYKEDVEKCLSAGMNDYISKPVVPYVLYAMLKKYLQQYDTL